MGGAVAGLIDGWWRLSPILTVEQVDVVRYFVDVHCWILLRFIVDETVVHELVVIGT